MKNKLNKKTFNLKKFSKYTLLCSFVIYLFCILGLRSENIKINLDNQHKEKEIVNIDEDLSQLESEINNAKKIESLDYLIEKYNLKKNNESVKYIKK